MNNFITEDYPVGSVGTLPVDIFKKSEHEEVMDELKRVDGELAEIKRRVKDLQTYPPPYIPYPQVPCCCYRFMYCWMNCYCCPYGKPYPRFTVPYYTEPVWAPYYTGDTLQWSQDIITGAWACT